MSFSFKYLYPIPLYTSKAKANPKPNVTFAETETTPKPSSNHCKSTTTTKNPSKTPAAKKGGITTPGNSYSSKGTTTTTGKVKAVKEKKAEKKKSDESCYSKVTPHIDKREPTLIFGLGLATQILPDKTIIYNNNNTCICWSHNMTTKGLRHIQVRENLVHKMIQKGIIDVQHINGKLNLADLFTKEDINTEYFISICDVLVQPQRIIHKPPANSNSTSFTF